MGQNPNLTAFTSKIQVFCRPEWTKGGPHENEFWQFLKCKNDVPKQLGLKKSRWKNWVTSLVFISSSWFMVLKLSKIVFFLQFFTDVSKKSISLIAIYVYASEVTRFALLRNGVGYYAIT